MKTEITITTENGEQEILVSSDLLVFIDETGEEKFSDNNNPLFGLGGCAVMEPMYSQEIRLPWNRLKEKHFDIEKALHAADLYQPSVEQVRSLASFFKEGSFLRFASIVTEKAELPPLFNPFQIVAYSVCKRIVDLVNINDLRPSRFVFLFEHSDRGNKLARRYFDTISFKYESGIPVPFKAGFVKKANREPGVEIADFIIHTAGAQSRVGLSTYRKDFRATFVDIDRSLMSFFLIDQTVKYTPAENS